LLGGKALRKILAAASCLGNYCVRVSKKTEGEEFNFIKLKKVRREIKFDDVCGLCGYVCMHICIYICMQFALKVLPPIYFHGNYNKEHNYTI